MKITASTLFALSLLSATHSVIAEVKPAALFSDHVVLQRGMEVPIWGAAREGENVTVEMAGQTVTTTAKDGKWMVRLKNLKEGGPFTLTIKGDNTVVFQDVLVGDVWLCGGQSNMERQLGLRNGQQPIFEWEKEAAAANYPLIRHFGVAQKSADTPQADVVGTWKVCTPENATNFTAVGYFFGRDLFQHLNVPIGLLHSSIGGTPAEAWTDHETLSDDPELKTILDSQAKAQQDYPALLAKYQADEPALLAKYQANLEQAQKDGKPAPGKPSPPRDPRMGNGRASVLYNAMIAPLQPFAIRGVIWYQGEANCGKPKLYRHLFPAMIGNWRHAWGQGDFPFLFVQLAPYRGNNAELREAQLMTFQSVPNTAMAVTTDWGDANDVHPVHKQPVGARLALAARALAYGEKVEFSGPIFASLAVDGANATLSFTHVGGGLVAKDGELRGFTIAGADKKFVAAKAEIKADKIVVSAPEVTQPVAVRFAWENSPDVNLFNADGLPASPFRTDPD